MHEENNEKHRLKMEHRQYIQDLEDEQREKNRKERERRQQKRDHNKFLIASVNQKAYN